jgi:hypothetical protein
MADMLTDYSRPSRWRRPLFIAIFAVIGVITALVIFAQTPGTILFNGLASTVTAPIVAGQPAGPYKTVLAQSPTSEHLYVDHSLASPVPGQNSSFYVMANSCDGCQRVSSGYRSELIAPNVGGNDQFKHVFIGGWYYLDADYPVLQSEPVPDTRGYHDDVIMQFHGQDATSPPLTVAFTGVTGTNIMRIGGSLNCSTDSTGALKCTGFSTAWSAPMPGRSKWFSFVMEYSGGQASNTGYIAAWMNGQQIITKTPWNTVRAGQPGTTLHTGLYIGWYPPGPRPMHTSGLVIGDTLDIVNRTLGINQSSTPTPAPTPTPSPTPAPTPPPQPSPSPSPSPTPTPTAAKTPLYRLYSGLVGDHFYTTSSQEADNATKIGYAKEGVSGYIYPTQVSGTIPLYRLYSGAIGDHFYTASLQEADNAAKLGFVREGITGYVYSSQASGTAPLYRLYSGIVGDHFYTTSAQESTTAAKLGYSNEGAAAYIFTAP